MTGRRAARRTALVLLYQWDLTGQPLASPLRGRASIRSRKSSPRAWPRTPASSTGVSPTASTDWPADRLGALERNILRIALTELDRGDRPWRS